MDATSNMIRLLHDVGFAVVFVIVAAAVAYSVRVYLELSHDGSKQ
jgi:hypothetical protein